MMKNKLGLYVHIPFCVRKCKYCDFLSFVSEDSLQTRYVYALVEEMKRWKEKVSAAMVNTIFIGGGTPSALSLADMDVVLQGIWDNFNMSSCQEFSIECNPGTVSEDKLSLYQKAGVNRISFGMQSTVEQELAKLGRIHTYPEFVASYELARKMGFSNINIDIMSAIPEQKLTSYEDTLQRVIWLAPEHISSYSLIIEEGTPFYELYREQPPVDEDTDRRMYERTKEILGQAGYDRYEISNYAKSGYECKHNLKYWQRGEYLGVGLGAASFMPDEMWERHCRFANVRSMDQYFACLETNAAEGKQLPVDEETVERLSCTDEMAEFMYLGLRCQKGVSVSDFEQQFGERLLEHYEKEIEESIQEGLLCHEKDRIRLTDRGIDVSNRVFQRFV